MKLIEALKAFPQLCGNGNWKNYARANELQFEDEIKNKDSAFARRPGQSQWDRLETLFPWPVPFWMRAKKKYCRKLVLLCALAHDVNKGMIEQEAERARVREWLLRRERKYPDVAAVFSVKEANQGFWF